MKIILLIQAMTAEPLREYGYQYRDEAYYFFAMSDVDAVLHTTRIFRPDLFVIEDQLASMTGAAFACQLAQQPGLAHIPCLLLPHTHEDFADAACAQEFPAPLCIEGSDLHVLRILIPHIALLLGDGSSRPEGASDHTAGP